MSSVPSTQPPDELSPAQDYDALRAEGIALLQRLSGHRWTDHNTHDPGITILEQLCYVLTDLGYRAGFSIPDLMAEGGDLQDWPGAFRPAAMLSSGPVRLEDWRKILLDTEGVRNAWIYPLDATRSDQYDARLFYDDVDEALRMSAPFIGRNTTRRADPLPLQGLYRVVFVPDSGHNSVNVKNSIRERLHARRNLCEDFHSIAELAVQVVDVEARIEIGAVSNPAQLLARVYHTIQTYLSPGIRFYSLSERLAQGHALEDILEGPVLDHGFIDEAEMRAFQLRQTLRISDLIRLIMDLEGVKAVHHLRLTLPGSDKKASTREGEAWELAVPPGTAPALNVPSAQETPKIDLWQGGLPVAVHWPAAQQVFNQLFEAEQVQSKQLRPEATALAPPSGQKRQVAAYQSVQHQFPDIYGIGHAGLPDGAPAARKAQARQLKAYLSLYDQLLANAFAQLSSLGTLFSLSGGSTANTWFSQSLRREIPDFDALIHWENVGAGENETKGEKEHTYDTRIQEYTRGTGPGGNIQNNADRRNRLLDHLLARFAERLTGHEAKVSDARIFERKEALLQQYDTLSRHRAKAFDYTLPSWDTENVATLERRLSLLLGFPLTTRRSLGALPDDDPGGFHLIEHILLRPGPGDLEQNSPILLLPFNGNDSTPPLKDPFSLQLSFVFPDWPVRLQEPGFRNLIGKTIREETPAHLRVYVHWLDKTLLKNFEEAFQHWVAQLNIR